MSMGNQLNIALRDIEKGAELQYDYNVSNLPRKNEVHFDSLTFSTSAASVFIIETCQMG